MMMIMMTIITTTTTTTSFRSNLVKGRIAVLSLFAVGTRQYTLNQRKLKEKLIDEIFIPTTSSSQSN